MIETLEQQSNLLTSLFYLAVYMAQILLWPESWGLQCYNKLDAEPARPEPTVEYDDQGKLESGWTDLFQLVSLLSFAPWNKITQGMLHNFYIRKWVFEFKSNEDAEKAVEVATDEQVNPRLGLLGLTGVIMEASSPEATSGSASGTNRALYGRLSQDFLEDDNDASDFSKLMKNHMQVI